MQSIKLKIIEECNQVTSGMLQNLQIHFEQFFYDCMEVDDEHFELIR